MTKPIKYKRKPRPVACAIFWVLATFTAISGAGWYYTLTGRMQITITMPPEPQVQQASYENQDMIDQFIAARAAEVNLTR